MMAVLKPNRDDVPEWSVFDKIYLVRRYNGELSSKEVTEAIWKDYGDDIAIAIAYSE